MAIVGSLVKETANAPGTSTTINLGGASAPFVTFVQGVGAGSGRGYMLQDGTQWEEGWGTVVDGSPDTLSRDTVLANSAGTTARLNFAGTTNVYSVIPSSKSVAINNSGTVDVGASTIKTTGTATVGGVAAGAGPITTTGTVSAGAVNGGAGTFSGKVTAANGAAGTDVVNWSQFANSATQAGYQKLPGGLIMQWGLSIVSIVGGTASIVYPISFPTDAFTVVVCNGDSSAVDSRVDVSIGPGGGGFSCRVPSVSSGSIRINWIALGH